MAAVVTLAAFLHAGVLADLAPQKSNDSNWGYFVLVVVAVIVVVAAVVLLLRRRRR